MRILRIIAFPISLIYAIAVIARNFLYDIRFFKSKSFDTPIVCVGNLSVGGTGKTPMIEYLVRLLEGYKVAILSRGYKRKSKGFLMADKNSNAQDLGDEPFQMYNKFPEITLAVDANRINGIKNLEKLVQPQLVLLDDAFQHRKVQPTLSILLTTFGKLYKDDWYLPTGDLRDSKREAKRANLIVVTKCPDDLSEENKERITKKLSPRPNQKVLFSHFSYAPSLKSGSGKTLDWNQLLEKKVAVVTGIANPEPFIAHLKSKDFQFQHLEYGDHHDFSTRELERLKAFDMVVTTEKDYVRMKGKLQNLYYLEVEHEFSKSDESVLREELWNLL
ncbi:tetraacyldisaccharide 4'-kinase [Flagellimonas allohymeniacidonis]|uniref:Tetraacyldisaccharide 4'-kinase n=1 Tax=Flagellimonas allohymeniacidonis TaxID=2517819 RepID=A0A4Q8QCP9_9FLAO|nr:tetraacyldisaccharide 4'-kinase [Allomuricauda hymeniacidonis]